MLIFCSCWMGFWSATWGPRVESSAPCRGLAGAVYATRSRLRSLRKRKKGVIQHQDPRIRGIEAPASQAPAL
eukprot:4159945-Pyramimonas_sp.AAC.1